MYVRAFYWYNIVLTVILIKIYKSSTVKRVNVLISRTGASRVWQVGNLWRTKIYFREIYASARGDNLLFCVHPWGSYISFAKRAGA